MTFSTLCISLAVIESTSSRLEMTSVLAELFNALEQDEVQPVCYILLGRLTPKYEGTEFNFAEKMMLRVLETCAPGAEIKKIYAELGDLGLTAEKVLPNVVEDTRGVLQVYADLLALAKEHGEGSQDRKLQAMVEILRLCTPMTAKYCVKMVLGMLRLGFSDMTMLDALSWAKTGDKSLRKDLELAYQMKADIGMLASQFLIGGLEALEHIQIEVGVPVSPALCQRLNSAQEMIDKMGKVYVEPKYDGTRVLIHVKKTGADWKVRTFTRNLEESSGMFPELVSILDDIDANEVILDSEAVGYNKATGELLKFQETIQRKRKHDVQATADKIPLRFFVFDILFKDGKELLSTPLNERKEILKQTVKEGDTFIYSPYIVTESADELREYHALQLSKGLEGAVIKQFGSVYQPGRRGWSWVKFKEEEGTQGKLSDTLDCMVMGMYVGQGKRAGFGIGAFLVGVRNEKTNQIQTIAKIGTGLSDEQWKNMFSRCTVLQTAAKPEEYDVPEALFPDVWVTPSLVVEIAADELTISPMHSAGKALRFPRLLRLREDKGVNQSTTVQELEQIG